MNYLVLLLALLIFVLGWKETKQMFQHFSDLEERRNLLLRAAGFFVMSWWIHIIPSILLTIYMKKEGVMASELLEEDSSRAIVTSLFMTPEIAFMVFAACWGGVWTAFEKSTLKKQKFSVVGGALVYFWGLVYFFMKHGVDYSLYIFAISAPIIAYSYIALCAPITSNIRYYWVPFLLVLVITFTLFIKDEITHSLVAKQLGLFGVGGNLTAAVSTRNGVEVFSGKLVLMTRESTYLRINVPGEKVKCTIHLSNSTSTIAVSDSPLYGSEDKKNAAHTLCRPQ